MNYRHRWQRIRQFVVAAMIVIALYSPQYPVASVWPLLTVLLLYLLWQIGFEFVLQSRRATEPARHLYLSIIQFIGSTGGVTFLVWFLYPLTAVDSWLLYLIPLLTVGCTLDRKWAFTFILLGVGLLALSAFAPYVHTQLKGPTTALLTTDQDLQAALRNFLLRGLVGAYVSFSSYLVIRSLAFQNRIITAATERMNEVTTSDSWHKAANSIAELIARTLSDEQCPVTANVIAYDKLQDKLTIVGSSSAEGQAQKGYQYTADQGVTGWAARCGLPCFMNDTAFDPERRFLEHEAFADTRSALAAPFPVDGSATVVLDVESSLTYAFASEDLQLLQIVGSHLRASHERTRILEVHRTLAKLGQDLAGSIIRVDQISNMLKQIGGIYKSLLGADSIVFYYRHSYSSPRYMRTPIGDFLTDHATATQLCEPDSLITELMDRQAPVFYPEAQADATGLAADRSHHLRFKIKPFVLRESIRSCAAIPLVVAQEGIGLMWINYRRQEAFDPAVRDLIQLLAPYASLAIQAGRQNQLQEEQRRETLRRMVHDSLAHRLQDVARGLDRLYRCASHTPDWNDELRIAKAQVTRAQHVVDNLIHQRTWLTLQSLVLDLHSQAQVIEGLYKIQVDFSSCDLPPTGISLAGGNELLYACDEAIGNALRHAQLTCLIVAIGCQNGELEVRICDDGIGFDPSTVTHGLGLYSIEARLRGLGGTAEIESQPGRGTRVSFHVPLPAPQPTMATAL